MKRLMNQTRGLEIASDVTVASSFLSRLIGLLGKRGLEDGQALWIERCNSIHTWFMRFPIDVVFVDKALVVRKVYRNIRPWRVTWPAWSASSVFEMAAGTLDRRPVEIGDRLHVGD